MRVRLAILVLILLAAAAAARAHIVPVGLGMQSYLKVEKEKVYLEYNLGYSELAGHSEIYKMEANRDSFLSKDEIEAWLEATQPKILGALEVTLDGKRLEFRLIERKTLALFANSDVKKLASHQFDTWWYFESDVALPPGPHTFKLIDRTFENEQRQSILWLSRPPEGKYRTFAFEPIPAEARVLDAGSDWQLFCQGYTLYVEFPKDAYAPEPAPAAAAAPAPTPAPPTVTAQAGSAAMRAFAEKSARDLGVEYRGSEENEETRQLVALRDEIWYLALAFATLWGAGHAVMPGHGKSMIAAYLLGTQGRISDAIKLGGIVTFTHSAANFVVAIAAILVAERVFGVSEHTAAARSTIAMEVIAGLAVFVIGVSLLYRRLQGIDDHHHHGHDHGHDHGHGHGHSHPRDHTSGGLLKLGFWAGFQPCIAGIALTSIAIRQGWLWKALYLLVAFSFGLGLVIIAIAVAMVAFKSLMSEKVKPEGRLIRALPAVSAALLTVVGAWMVVDTLMKNKIGPFAHG